MENIYTQSSLVSECADFIKNRSVILSCLLITVIVWYLKYLWGRRKLYWYSMKIPGPLSLPFIGSAYLFMGTGSQILKKLMKVQEDYPKLGKVWFVDQLYIFVSEPKHIETILSSPRAIEKNYIYDVLSEMMGAGLVTAKGKIWKPHRKTIAPSFTQKNLDSFVYIFSEKSKIFSEILKKFVGKKDVEWYVLVARYTLDTLSQTTMGINLNVQTEKTHDMGEFLEKGMEMINLRMFRFYYHIPMVWYFSKARKQCDTMQKEFQKITSAVVKKKREIYENEKMGKGDSERNTLLDLILESSNFTEKETYAEVDTFLIAGTDTSATTICAMFTILGMFPDIQQKVLDEVIDIIGNDRDVEASDLSKMVYTERVIKETLRLFPIGALFMRTLPEDMNLGDVTVPKGCSLAFCTVAIHRNPEYWKDPLKFDPDRFLPEEVAKRHPCTYIPFSYGPRNCIGGRYAMINLKTIMATVLRKFKVFSEYKSIEEIVLKLELFLRFENGFKIWFESR